MRNWWINADLLGTSNEDFFMNLYQTGKIPGVLISSGPLNSLFKLNHQGKNYYIKWYYQSGKHLRKYIGKSRLKREKDNLLLFRELGIRTVPLIVFGEKSAAGFTKQGMLVTQEIINTADLATLAEKKSLYLTNRTWLMSVMQQVADFTQKLHEKNFIHNDLKWRNILVTCEELPQVYFIDCPSGKKTTRLFLKRGIIKDLACLDKKAKYHLSKTMRLRFYFRYAGIKKLSTKDKKDIYKILNFFAGRE